jgi:hypothetical protein
MEKLPTCLSKIQLEAAKIFSTQLTGLQRSTTRTNTRSQWLVANRPAELCPWLFGD